MAFKCEFLYIQLVIGQTHVNGVNILSNSKVCWVEWNICKLTWFLKLSLRSFLPLSCGCSCSVLLVLARGFLMNFIQETVHNITTTNSGRFIKMSCTRVMQLTFYGTLTLLMVIMFNKACLTCQIQLKTIFHPTKLVRIGYVHLFHTSFHYLTQSMLTDKIGINN